MNNKITIPFYIAELARIVHIDLLGQKESQKQGTQNPESITHKLGNIAIDNEWALMVTGATISGQYNVEYQFASDARSYGGNEIKI